MARTCNHNNDCPQGKTCQNGWCAEPTSGGGPPVYTCNQNDQHCPPGRTCQNGTCVAATTPPPTQTPPPPQQAPPPGSPGGPSGGQTAAPENCEMVCQPLPDPYAAAAGSQPYTSEGYLSSYSTPNVQEGIGPGGHDPRDQAYLQNYQNQEQAYEQDWQNYYTYMNQGGTTPAPVTVASQAATNPGYTTQQGDNTTPFTQYLANPYGY